MSDEQEQSILVHDLAEILASVARQLVCHVEAHLVTQAYYLNV
jgi:hypothetical protein